jgi:hypothetical protein
LDKLYWLEHLFVDVFNNLTHYLVGTLLEVDVPQEKEGVILILNIYVLGGGLPPILWLVVGRLGIILDWQGVLSLDLLLSKPLFECGKHILERLVQVAYLCLDALFRLDFLRGSPAVLFRLHIIRQVGFVDDCSIWEILKYLNLLPQQCLNFFGF